MCIQIETKKIQIRSIFWNILFRSHWEYRILGVSCYSLNINWLELRSKGGHLQPLLKQKC